MFVRINDDAIINTDHVSWIDTSSKKSVVMMADGTEHKVETDKLDKAIQIINLATNSMAYK